MICYKDRTFCKDEECKHFGVNCDKSLTEETKQDAYKWWGNEKAPIAIYIGKLNCFEAKK